LDGFRLPNALEEKGFKVKRPPCFEAARLRQVIDLIYSVETDRERSEAFLIANNALKYAKKKKNLSAEAKEELSRLRFAMYSFIGWRV